MTNRIANAFQDRPAFMPYYPIGYPTVDISVDVIAALAQNGADLIEVGMPFSDPLADGPVIQHATQIALQNGVTTRLCLDCVAALRQRGIVIPLILMAYYNPLFNYGLHRLAEDAVQAGADGIIIPDLPVEESNAAQEAFAGRLPLIRMLAPTTTPERAKRICQESQGFLYVVSVTGVTGERTQVSVELPDLISRVRQQAPAAMPVCVGFGISTPSQAADVGKLADGVIVGTACVKTIGAAADPALKAGEFARSYRDALASIRDRIGK
jgi:tryptophan synthase alpha chain